MVTLDTQVDPVKLVVQLPVMVVGGEESGARIADLNTGIKKDMKTYVNTHGEYRDNSIAYVVQRAAEKMKPGDFIKCFNYRIIKVDDNKYVKQKYNGRNGWDYRSKTVGDAKDVYWDVYYNSANYFDDESLRTGKKYNPDVTTLVSAGEVSPTDFLPIKKGWFLD